MLNKLIKAVFGDKKVRDRKKLQPVVDEINGIFEELESLSDEDLQNKTNEFRKLLHAAPHACRAGDQIVFFDQAEQFLNNHPDVDKAIFSGTRRDYHAGDVAAFVRVKEGVDASEDLAEQIRAGMSRLGAGYSPKSVFFVDEFPTYEDERQRTQVDRHKIALAAEKFTGEKSWRKSRWSDLENELEIRDPFEVEELLPDAFATVKEVCRRHIGKSWTAAGADINWNMVPFDVQLMGAISLARGNISEMATGEGKTLTAIMPLYLHALYAKGSHLVTVNDYLSKRDSEWNAPIFSFLGMLVGCLDKTDSHTPERRLQYGMDITYGTVNEYGFDYLRDNMARQRSHLVQRGHQFAIIDEVDSVLIDEARTPLIISGPVERPQDHYIKILPTVRKLVQEQNVVVSRLAKEAEELLAEAGDEMPYEAGFKLLQCYKAMPKHKRYMKLRNEPRYQRLQEKIELDLMQEKQMVTIEEDLYFLVDEKQRQAELTEKGRLLLNPDNPDYWVLDDIVDQFAKIEQDDELSEEEKTAKKREARAAHDMKGEELHAISQLLHAHVLKIRDVDYVVEEDKVVIVDENTGRKMPGRRWSDGLHQAVEAKEGVKIEAETQTLATITIQNYFRHYKTLSGMTGTAETEAAEFHGTYKMDVVCIPSNRPLQRKDLQDLVFRTKSEKYNAVIEEVERLHNLGLPVLVGTTNVQDSEKLSRMFKLKALKHEVLNAKNHQSEASIVAQAGQPGAITIATNMAGRGTDIKLGEGVRDPKTDEDGNEWPGGLQIIGTERHEARRIDRQLRGRSGRQGDPGTSRFFVSLEDNLMLWFGSERISIWLERLGMKEGEAIESRLVTNSIEKAQQKVEMINYERRQRILRYDDVMNKQREQVYTLRRDILTDEEIRTVMLGVFEDAIAAEFDLTYGEKTNMGDADINGFIDWVDGVLTTEPIDDMKKQSWPDYEELHDALMVKIAEAYDEKMKELGDISDPFCRMIGLQTIDRDWQDHLLAIDDLRESIGLRSYGQRDTLVEFTEDATMLFEEFMLNVNKNIFQVFFRAQPMTQEQRDKQARAPRVTEQKPQLAAGAQPQGAEQPDESPAEEPRKSRRPKKGVQPFRRDKPRIGS